MRGLGGIGGMLRLFKAGIAAGLLFVGAPVLAEQVDADTLNCRSAPDTSAQILSKLNRGDRVNVAEVIGVWSRLDSPNCWVQSRYLTNGGDPTFSAGFRAWGSESASSHARSSTPSTLYSSPRSSSAKQPVRRSQPSYGGSCPCSGGRVCIGPRGGRYCITSGGNKRYGV